MSTVTTRTQPESGPKERFFRYFQQEATALQEQMERLENTSLAGGERTDAVDHCLAGIGRLSSEVNDASGYIPAYDQRTYKEAIKALTEKLQETRAAFAPKQKFTFKTSRKNNSAISLQDAVEIASSQRLKIPGYRSNFSSSAESSYAPTPETRTPPNGAASSSSDAGAHRDGASDKDGVPQPSLLSAQSAAIRKPSFSQSKSVVMSNHKDVHIILPSSAADATSSGSLTSLRRSVVDMSVPTSSTSGGHPFAGLTLRGVRDSLIVCGHVNGPAHVTGVENSVIVTACRQFRMHDCKNVDVYLMCRSRPIIEDCSAVRFAPLPKTILVPADAESDNQYDQVDDFKWLKAEHSPNWRVLPEADRISEEVWSTVVPGGPGISLDDILAQTVGGIPE